MIERLVSPISWVRVCVSAVIGSGETLELLSLLRTEADGTGSAQQN
jgi:hypothetical protein